MAGNCWRREWTGGGWAALLAVMASSACGAYLPQVGPAPLRFRSPPVVLATVVTLPPPLPPAETISTNEIQAAVPGAPPAVALENTEPLGLWWFETNLLEHAQAAPPALPPPAEAPGATITPQMLAEFFKPVALGTNTPLVLPAAFVPPQAPSSSATYKQP